MHEKVCVVTGASRGIGKGCAAVLAAQGAIVYGTSRSQGADVSSLTAATVAGVVMLKCDHTNDAAVKAMFDYVFRAHGKVDVLVNNAG